MDSPKYLRLMLRALSDQGPEATQRLSDRQEIAELMFEYCYACDENDPDGIAACFVEDCVTDYGPGPGQPTRGRNVRRTEAARDLALFDATSHLLSNVSVSFLDEDRARVRSVVHAWHQPKDSTSSWILYGQYHDTVTRTEEGWRIAERKLLVVAAEGFPAEWSFHGIDRLSPEDHSDG